MNESKHLPAVASQSTFALLRPDNVPRKLSIDVVAEKVRSVIDGGSFISGNLEFQWGVKIDGRVKGDVNFGTETGLCIVSSGGHVVGNLSGPHALIVGRVDGDLDIEGVCFLAPTAVVVGSISAGRLLALPGADIDGKVRTRKQLDAPADTPTRVQNKLTGVTAKILSFGGSRR